MKTVSYKRNNTGFMYTNDSCLIVTHVRESAERQETTRECVRNQCGAMSNITQAVHCFV